MYPYFFSFGNYKLLAEVNASIAIGSNHSVILKTDGSLWSVGNNSKGQLGDGTTNDQNFSIQIISADVTNISSGNTHTLFIKSDNSLWGIGNNSGGNWEMAPPQTGTHQYRFGLEMFPKSQVIFTLFFLNQMALFMEQDTMQMDLWEMAH